MITATRGGTARQYTSLGRLESRSRRDGELRRHQQPDCAPRSAQLGAGAARGGRSGAGPGSPAAAGLPAAGHVLPPRRGRSAASGDRRDQPGGLRDGPASTGAGTTVRLAEDGAHNSGIAGGGPNRRAADDEPRGGYPAGDCRDGVTGAAAAAGAPGRDTDGRVPIPAGILRPARPGYRDRVADIGRHAGPVVARASGGSPRGAGFGRRMPAGGGALEAG